MQPRAGQTSESTCRAEIIRFSRAGIQPTQRVFVLCTFRRWGSELSSRHAAAVAVEEAFISRCLLHSDACSRKRIFFFPLRAFVKEAALLGSVMKGPPAATNAWKCLKAISFSWGDGSPWGVSRNDNLTNRNYFDDSHSFPNARYIDAIPSRRPDGWVWKYSRSSI